MDDYTKIPTVLKMERQWVNFIHMWNEKDQKNKKVPISPHTLRGASSTNSETWASYEEVINNIGKVGTVAEGSAEISGIGFVFTNGYFGIDLDHVKVNGEYTGEAKDILTTMDSYAEESMSGDGIHIIAKDFELTPGMNKRIGNVEMYSGGRFFVMTGKTLNDKDVESRSAEALTVWNKYLKRDTREKPRITLYSDINLSDRDLLALAFKSRSGSEIEALWNGYTNRYGNDSSRADLALINHLLFWTNGDTSRTDSLFRQSGLMRDKWDERHGRDTYGNITIEKAMQSFTSGYEPSKKADNVIIVSESKEITSEMPRPHAADKYLENILTDDIEKFKIYKNRKTGFKNLDEQCGGLYPGLYAVGAISSLGKTTFIQQIGDQLAQAGEHVLFFSLEQNRFEMVTKSLSRITAQIDVKKAVSAINIRRGEITPEVVIAAEMYKKYADRISIIECNFDTNIQYILNYVNEYIKINGVKPVIIVDYLQIIPPTDLRQSDKEKVDNIVRGLKKLQSENDLIVFVVSSINRANYLSPIDFESFKESGGIEYTCDVVWGLQLQILNDDVFGKVQNIKEKREKVRDAKKAVPRKIELICLKNRYGISSYTCGFEYNPVYDLFVPDEPNGKGKVI